MSFVSNSSPCAYKCYPTSARLKRVPANSGEKNTRVLARIYGYDFGRVAGYPNNIQVPGTRLTDGYPSGTRAPSRTLFLIKFGP